MYRALFVLGCAATAVGVFSGVVYSFRVERGMPEVALVDQLGGYLTSIEDRIQAGDHDAAIAQLELTLKLLHQQQHLTEEMLGRALLGKGDVDQAIAHLRRALRLVPGFAEAHHTLALALARRGNLDLALAEMRAAARLDPASEAIRHNLTVLERRVEREGASLAPAGEAPPAGEHAAEIARARDYLRRFYRGELDELRQSFTPGLARSVSSEQFRDMHDRVSRQLGAESALLDERVSVSGATRTYVRRSRFERHDGEVEIVIELAVDEAIDGFAFRPATGAPGS